jgi:hypothetical protein
LNIKANPNKFLRSTHWFDWANPVYQREWCSENHPGVVKSREC